MKKTMIFLALVSILFAFPVISQEKPAEPPISTIKLTGKIYKIVSNEQVNVNMIVFTGDEGILMVDDGLSKTAEAIRNEIKKISDKPVKYIVNTHYHGDHTGGNAYFGKEGKIIAHKNVLKALTSGESLLQELPKEALPGIIVDKEMDLKFNGEDIKFISFPESHSSGDMIVYFKNEGIVALGDLLFSDRFPFIDLNHGGNIDNYINASESFLKMFPSNTLFVGGHGRDYKMEDLQKHLDIIKKTVALIRNEMKSGRKMDEIKKADILKEWDNYGKSFISKDAWVEAVYNFTENKGKPWKPMVYDTLITVLMKKDVNSMVELYRNLKRFHADEYSFHENYLNALGYALLGKGKTKDAITIFILNTEEYPKSSNVWDSLGEGYMIDGNKELSIINYKKSLEYDPNNGNAKKMIEKQSK